MTPRAKAPMPYPFVAELLAAREPVIRPMFGAFALYCGGRITLVLRKRPSHPEMNGVWVATTKEHHASLRALMPCLRSIPLLGKGETNWQLIPEADEEFERAVMAACELVLRRDRRIGTVPKARRAARP